MEASILNKKPKRLWEWREYKSGSLIENGVALNETATFIWKLCDGKRTVDQIISEVLKNYDVSEERTKQDILNYIKLLIKEKTLKIS